MGYAFDELIPVAVLLDHPGVTKEEFVELLEQTTSDGWSTLMYHTGLEGLAAILQLKTNPRRADEIQRDYQRFAGVNEEFGYA